MKAIAKLFLWMGVALLLTGCITKHTPPNDAPVELASGASQSFTAVSDDRSARLVWYLDDEKVAGRTGKYTFTAEEVGAGEVATHKLVVREENSKYRRYYKYLGLPDDFAVSVTWTIKVISDGTTICYLDEDLDGFGDINKKVEFGPNEGAPENCISDNTDCNDDDAESNPDAEEICGNDIDENCDGDAATCVEDADGDGYSSPEDCDDGNADVNPGAAEVCGNDVDENCDGEAPACAVDDDGDGYSPPEDCDDNNVDVNPGAAEVCGNDVDENCDGEAPACVVDEDGDGYSPPEDCDDGNGDVNPGAAEVCGNDVDENCDGEAPACVVDEDGDGYSPPEDCDDGNGDVNPGVAEVCGNDIDENCDGVVAACIVDDDGDGFSPPQDCDDGNAAVNPGAAEVCGNDIDENCDGNADPCDADGDGYFPPEDCDDDNGDIHPGAEEVCGNDIDENCDGNIEPCDADGDGYSPPEDCDDSNGDIHPGAEEVCGNDIDENCDGNAEPCDADGDGYSPPEDCDDSNGGIHPGAEEVCGNDIDENCDGEICAGPPAPVENVDATDIESGLHHITVTWDAGDNVDYYNVYRAPFEEDGDYELVGENITETTFDFIQTWDEDVYSVIGDFPAFAPDADYDAKRVFSERLAAYGQEIIPTLFNFKAPAFFKVEACNDEGCAELSAADVGQAELIHTAEHSEVALLAIPGWGNAGLGMLADAPPGADALSWCGIDICGLGGGRIMGRLDSTTGLPMVDVYYEDYTEIWDRYPNTATFTSAGWLGGIQQLLPSLQGILNLSGDFDLSFNGVEASMFVYMHVGGTQGPNKGYVSVAYKGETYQFSLPVVDRGDGFSDPPAPVVEDDEANKVDARETLYPEPFSEVPPVDGCLTLKDDPVEICQ